MKRASKRLLAFLLVLTMAIGIMPFAAISVGAVEPAATEEGANNIQFAVANQTVDAEMQGNTIIAPDAVVDCMFAWYGVVTNGDTSKQMLIAPGETVTFQQGDVAVFRPLALDITQISDPTLRMKDEEIAGMRFVAGVSKIGYQKILDMIKNGALENASISLGTLFEVPNGTKKNVPFNMVLDTADNPVWYKEDEAVGYISGTIWDSEIEAMVESSGMDLSTAGVIATGYAKLTFGGKNYYAYAKNENKKATPIYELAIEALNKISSKQDSNHKLQVGKNLYSPYSVSERDVLCDLVDNAVSLRTVESEDKVELMSYAHYNPNSKWKITKVTEGDADWSTLLGQLGNPAGLVSICKLEATDANASAEGGVLLDGVLIEGLYQGSNYYLIGISGHTSID